MTTAIKYHIFTIIVLLTTVSVSYGQGSVSWGVKGGFNLSINTPTTLTFSTNTMNQPQDNIDLSNLRLGGQLGAVVTIPIVSQFAFRAELMYALKGSKKLSIHYFNVPLSFSYSLTEKVGIHLGGEAGYRLVDTNYRGPEETIDLGVLIGGSYSLSDNITIEIRYIHGLRPFINNEFSVSDINFPSIKSTAKTRGAFNRSLQISAIYYF